MDDSPYGDWGDPDTGGESEYPDTHIGLGEAQRVLVNQRLKLFLQEKLLKIGEYGLYAVHSAVNLAGQVIITLYIPAHYIGANFRVYEHDPLNLFPIFGTIVTTASWLSMQYILHRAHQGRMKRIERFIASKQPLPHWNLDA